MDLTRLGSEAKASMHIKYIGNINFKRGFFIESSMDHKHRHQHIHLQGHNTPWVNARPVAVEPVCVLCALGCLDPQSPKSWPWLYLWSDKAALDLGQCFPYSADKEWSQGQRAHHGVGSAQLCCVPHPHIQINICVCVHTPWCPGLPLWCTT
jgi:hypothetical protein